ncbi:hypothetical protein DQ04_03371030 [Trypanosoma grayi]|uniref:hypothetical protein n=1 Tax=Trypanosoma grayi TaxID=71804 RepID=UPI0004F410D9|nr:hypothetical protein DQ04_03371030 [Trypanosoma grayi]KEG10723.1 hypothetical protein DQ04_03371030 [Trypanosoma grayi]
MRSSHAKRASRGSVKEPAPIPYTASSPFVVHAKQRKSTKQPRAVSFLTRVASAVLQKFLQTQPPPLQYGDVLRDVPFHLHNRIVGFFSTHPSLCEDDFGVCHGQCIRFTRGPWTNETAVVVGARGGYLWVVNREGPATARPLYAPEWHGWEKVAAEPELLVRLREGLEAAHRDADLDYDPEQREFLQKAPDLFAEVVDDEDNYGAGDVAVDDGWGEQKASCCSGRVSSNTADGHSVLSDASTTLSRARKRVILVPQVVQVSGDLGWAGEGVVVVDGGGVKSFSSSLSASVLL